MNPVRDTQLFPRTRRHWPHFSKFSTSARRYSCSRPSESYQNHLPQHKAVYSIISGDSILDYSPQKYNSERKQTSSTCYPILASTRTTKAMPLIIISLKCGIQGCTWMPPDSETYTSNTKISLSREDVRRLTC